MVSLSSKKWFHLFFLHRFYREVGQVGWGEGRGGPDSPHSDVAGRHCDLLLSTQQGLQVTRKRLHGDGPSVQLDGKIPHNVRVAAWY